jgi:hypothetical protein
MKTLIITNFPEKNNFLTFQTKFAAELKRSDVIFIKIPENITDLEE